jgi:hypothetical protein
LIDFRYHIVSLIAVFLALALGLFLGSTTLQSTVTHNLQSQAHRLIAKNQQDRGTIAQQKGDLGRLQKFLAGVAPYAVEGRLVGHDVAIVAAPGLSSDDTSAVQATLQQAGATVTTAVQLQSAYLDPTQDAELGGLATQLRLPGHKLPRGSGATQASSELAAVLTTRPGAPPVAKVHVDATLTALADGKFLSIAGDPPTHAADLAVLLLPAADSSTSPTTATAQDTILLDLANQLRRASTLLVVAGETATPAVDGALKAVQSDSTLGKSVSTVDLGDSAIDPDHTAGRMAVVLALAGAATASPGDYGLSQRPPVPVPSPTP